LEAAFTFKNWPTAVDTDGEAEEGGEEAEDEEEEDEDEDDVEGDDEGGIGRPTRVNSLLRVATPSLPFNPHKKAPMSDACCRVRDPGLVFGMYW
jgi:hypothetical protein